MFEWFEFQVCFFLTDPQIIRQKMLWPCPVGHGRAKTSQISIIWSKRKKMFVEPYRKYLYFPRYCVVWKLYMTVEKSFQRQARSALLCFALRRSQYFCSFLNMLKTRPSWNYHFIKPWVNNKLGTKAEFESYFSYELYWRYFVSYNFFFIKDRVIWQHKYLVHFIE